jgi:hypothetical protein
MIPCTFIGLLTYMVNTYFFFFTTSSSSATSAILDVGTGALSDALYASSFSVKSFEGVVHSVYTSHASIIASASYGSTRLVVPLIVLT